ncbi:S8 family serine peptidase [Deinococcus sp. KSM4-11]|uniref:S8 family serine peptidase n=1 Tax=Deinococcus sp. KSM4-11 TaxID=2568654 RepID=UPI001F101A9D|nr:S8 family serine peptidase [Deinococcus sp. KSM4-11]
MKITTAVSAFLLTGLLAACAGTSGSGVPMPGPAPITQPVTTPVMDVAQEPVAPLAVPAERFAQLAVVSLLPGDRSDTVGAELKGKVMAWNAAGCATGQMDECTATVGLNTALSPQRLAALSARKVTTEVNRDAFSGGGALTATMGGAIGIWSGGAIGIWSGGAIGIWSGGTYNPLPQNSAVWTKIGLEKAHTLAPKLGAGVTVAVIDTGIDLNHPAFKGLLSAPATWHDFYANDDLPEEEGTLGTGAYGHGTNVAGIILQVAPAAKVMPLRVLGPDGSGDVAMVSQAIDWAVSHGAQVVNLSLGSTENSTIIQGAIARATAQGVLVVSSAGNENRDQITYPAALARNEGTAGDLALSVGSVSLSDVKSTFSNYAKALELVAPGENVYAPAPDGRMASWSGTSMAAPMVSGGLALALGQPLYFLPKYLPSTLAYTASDVYHSAGNTPYKDKLGVRGRLDLATFLTFSVHR